MLDEGFYLLQTKDFVNHLDKKKCKYFRLIAKKLVVYNFKFFYEAKTKKLLFVD